MKAPKPERPKKAPDLMEALKASLEGRGDGGGAGNGKADLSKLSKSELYERAKKADIAGRPDMSKEKLVEALT